jgi:hypothetical protein
MLNKRFLSVFRRQAPGSTLQLPMDTRIDALKSAPIRTGSECFQGGARQKSKKDFSLDEKKWTSFQRSIF